jgi:ubiquinone/menaquinone biosynthesis C-methylase UbiE
VHKKFAGNKFDVAVIRGVLHHLYYPEDAIKKISKIADNVLVLEPSGYNPIVKIIEKTSPYHIAHQERSYWPPTLNKWFKNAGYKVLRQKYFGIVPYFCNEKLAKMLKIVEPFFELIPLIKIYGGTNIILYTKKGRVL